MASSKFCELFAKISRRPVLPREFRHLSVLEIFLALKQPIVRMLSTMKIRLIYFAIATLGLHSACVSGKIQTIQDPFEGEKKSFGMYLDTDGYTAILVQTAKNKYTIEVLVVQKGHASEPAIPGRDKAEFLIGNQIVTLKNQITAPPVSNATKYEIFTQWKLSFNLDRKLAAKFGTAPLSAIRVTIGGLEFRLPVSATDGEKIRSNMVELTT